MSEDLFAPAWARVDRANELPARMAQLWNDYISSDPFTPSLIGEGDGVYILRVWEDQPPPAELAVATGEWLYNVRSALDFVVWATAAHESGLIPPPNEAQLQYPIYDTEDAWNRNLYRLKNLAEHHRSMLKVMQPFSSSLDANYLGWINRLARIDRHRHLNHMTAYLAKVEPVFAFPDDCTVTLQWGERVVRDGKADVARIVVSPWHEGMDIQFNPRIGVDPEIEAWSGSEFWRRINYSVMGKRMFDAGEQAWPEKAPFYTPVFVVTHEKRDPWERPGGTTFHFVNDGGEDDFALDRALERSKLRPQVRRRGSSRDRAG